MKAKRLQANNLLHTLSLHRHSEDDLTQNLSSSSSSSDDERDINSNQGYATFEGTINLTDTDHRVENDERSRFVFSEDQSSGNQTNIVKTDKFSFSDDDDSNVFPNFDDDELLETTQYRGVPSFIENGFGWPVKKPSAWNCALLTIIIVSLLNIGVIVLNFVELGLGNDLQS
eukprot:CAMPEP_0201549620 /NCGR_PEP_ID=MMETSP0173_2-20130828/6077_1 /ASSEMBLY_ACC=CAM_ASM_000268 /TAXON_ID=218659 /ORGANISM="Vexillifera sp., Strain DIVA3 564/2" /LENGTH=171 /DNA_ID=CAMNT_0047959345 /DNA_START=561 /DNA_END=1076 /DNA_ORIENTATION=+